MKRLVEIDDATHVVVPRAPTAEMINAGERTSYSDVMYPAPADAYAAMIAAAPPLCETCGDYGMVGGRSGQTPESYQEHGEPCPDCNVAPTLPDAQAVTDEDIASFLAEPFELNYSNYNSDDVEKLQNWALRAYDIIKARAALSAAAPAWQPIETAPKDGTEILLTNGVVVAQGQWLHEDPFNYDKRDMDGAYIDQAESDSYDDWMDCEGGMNPGPTHWMPLPSAPVAAIAAASKEAGHE